jgi:hypothetical protein
MGTLRRLVRDRSANPVYYAVSLLLVSSYLVVGGLALSPNASPEYHQYYVEGNVESWPGEDGLEYALGDRLPLGEGEGTEVEIAQRGSGWSEQERWGVWTDATEAHLVFVLDGERPRANLQLSLNATGFASEDAQTVEAFVNGQRVSSLNVQVDRFATYDVTIPESHLRVHDNGETVVHVVFEIQNPTSPAELGINDDSRRLGMGVRWLELDRANRTADERGDS